MVNHDCQAKNRFFGVIQSFTALRWYSGRRPVAGSQRPVCSFLQHIANICRAALCTVPRVAAQGGAIVENAAGKLGWDRARQVWIPVGLAGISSESRSCICRPNSWWKDCSPPPESQYNAASYFAGSPLTLQKLCAPWPAHSECRLASLEDS